MWLIIISSIYPIPTFLQRGGNVRNIMPLFNYFRNRIINDKQYHLKQKKYLLDTYQKIDCQNIRFYLG